MGQQEKISRALQFVGDAKHSQNIRGPMHEKMHHFHDHFDQVSMDTVDWTAYNNETADSCAIDPGVGGILLLTMGNADDDSNSVGGQIIYEAVKNCICEARLKVTDITDTACFFGFSDADNEDDHNMAIAYDSDSVTSGADNAVGFVLDKDGTSHGGSADEWICCGVFGGTDSLVNVSSGVTAVSDTWVTLRVELDGSTTYAKAIFYINGIAVGTIPGTSLVGAVTSTTDLCVVVQGENRDSTAGTIYIDRIDCWQDEN